MDEKLNDVLTKHCQIENEQLKNLLNVAYNEMSTCQYEAAKRHYEDAYLLNPDLYIVNFMKTYCGCYCGTRGEVHSQAKTLNVVLYETFDIIKNNSNLVIAEKDVEYAICFEYYAKAIAMLFSNAVQDLLVITRDGVFTAYILINLIDNSGLSDYPLLNEQIFKFLKENRSKTYTSDRKGVDAKLRELNPSYVPEKKGCYVATCVYGSYDCPQVWTLRRYRDYKLAETWHGRLFIKVYYAISPTLVKWFGDKEWFKKLWKNKLDHMVEKYRKLGYNDTPYNDINW